MRAWLIRRMLGFFRAVSRTSLWFETRFTATGRLIIGGAIVATIFGIDPSRTLALQLSAVLLGIIIVAIFASLRWRPQLELVRDLPETVTVDIATSYSISITNDSDHAEYNLVLTDRLLTRYPTPEAFGQQKSDGREFALHWFDRWVGFPRWLDLLRMGRGARLDAIPLPPIAAHSTITVAVPLVPLRRGKLIFTEQVVKRSDPIGIFFAMYRVSLYGDVISLPKRHPVPTPHWVSERHFHRGGVTQAATVGDSEEFIGLREYRPGDPLRHIHWRSFAKRCTPVVKEYQDEYFDRHALVVDTFLGTAAPINFEAVVSVAASFIESSRPNDSILDLVFIEQQIWRLSTGRGLSDNRHVLLQLAELQPSAVDDFAHLAEYLRRHGDRLASIIMVCTTWDTTRQTFVEELQNRRLRCLALLVGETEVAPDLVTDIDLRQIRPSVIAQDIAAMAS